MPNDTFCSVLIPTVYRLLLKSALSGTCHRIHTTKKIIEQLMVQEDEAALYGNRLYTHQVNCAIWRGVHMSAHRRLL